MAEAATAPAAISVAAARTLAEVAPHFGGGGRGGHFWHGRFWGYGIGPCWRLTPYGEYVWVCY
jgi:hypothetical protein